MRRKSKRPAPHHGLAIALVFVCLVGILVAISLLIKGYLVVKKSRFDGNHQFIVQVTSLGQTDYIAFNPDTKSVDELTVMGHSSGPVLLADATVKNVNSNNPLQLADTLISHPGKFQSTLTEVDIARLVVFSHTVQLSSVTKQSVAMPQDEDTLTQLLPQLFTDHTLYQENVAVGIVNATGVTGVGEAVARLLSAIGVNIISVTSIDNTQNSSSIVYANSATYTSSRLSGLLQIPAEKGNTTPGADITVTIGTDRLGLLGIQE